ncbi:MAG: metalloregulator ArsR/SmtB family transcription factor [Chloroflexota bacterium]
MAPYENAALRFKALAHPVRLQILDMLRTDDEVCVCHMEAAFGKRQAYISQQLMVLRDAGLVESRRDGLKVFYRLADDPTRDLLAAALGPANESGPATFAGCPCPHCAAAAEASSTH